MKKSSLVSASAIILLVLMCVPPVYSETILSIEDFESPIIISLDASLTINVGEKATLQNDINIQPEQGTPLVKIVNHGELTIKAKINCTGANLTIQNTGKLTFQDENINITSLANLNVINEGEMVVNNCWLDANYGGTITLDSRQGTLTVDNSGIDASGSFYGHLSTIEVITGKSTWIKSGINGVGANLTIRNTGELTFQDETINLSGWATLFVVNEGKMVIHNQTVGVYAGYCYFTNDGNLTTDNWRLKDQNDGTFFTNNGDANLTDTSFIANGAAGKHIIVNKGNLQLTQCMLDTNYGGTINLDSRQGTLNVNSSRADANGSSHGNQSTIELTTGKTTWTNTTLSTKSASLVYSDYGAGSTIQNCTFIDIAYNIHGQATMTESTSINSNLHNFGDLTLNTCNFAESNTTIENSNHMEMVNTQIVCENSLNVTNVGTIDGDWMLKTKNNGDAVLTNKGTITFNQPFIENTSSQELTSLGVNPKVFTQTSGTITVINQGIIQTATTNTPNTTPTPMNIPTPNTTPTSTPTPTNAPTATNTAPTSNTTPTNTPATTNTAPTTSPTSTKTPQPATTPTNTPTPTTNSPTEEPPFLYIGLAILAVLVILVILVVWKRKKKDQNP
jgi:hypothetical protein